MCVVWFDNNMTTKREEVDGGGDDDDDNGLLFFLIFPWEMPYVSRGGREREGSSAPPRYCKAGCH